MQRNRILIEQIETPDQNKTDVFPGLNLYEDDSMLIALLPYKDVKGHMAESKLTRKAYQQKRWQFWSNHDGKQGVYIIMVRG